MERDVFRFGFALIVLGVSAGLAHAEPPTPVSEYFADHPLVGKIWSVEERRFVTPGDLVSEAAESRYVLLGEIHDNPDHHALQAWVVRSIAEKGRRPAVVFEMISQDMQNDIDAYLALADSNSEGFGAALRWEERGWPSWETYKPVLDAAITFGLPVRAGDANVRSRKAVGKDGLIALGEAEEQRLGLSEEETDAERELVSNILFESHCGLVPRESLKPMADVQAFRDAALADAMLGSPGNGAALIAGGGHARDDLAVPKFLRRRGVSGDEILTVAFREVEPGEGKAADYLPQSVNETKTFDYLWFTPVYDRTDHCADFKKRFGETPN
ncbi:hypothetical protein GR183_11860 [Stappia sp. GBMRC 2046]|uniref:Haem-binding uptake Tiki superfamily ChaN domain-containing protein n=1 Tax=Stappia sediminis TaxID=2692190 RepID=A0A7X3LV06_9HYPH|nr:ChaN family lipoprotein [Stappia sediminis]MXN65599.1 hypothetical protein [Stappia sediminis]